MSWDTDSATSLQLSSDVRVHSLPECSTARERAGQGLSRRSCGTCKLVMPPHPTRCMHALTQLLIVTRIWWTMVPFAVQDVGYK